MTELRCSQSLCKAVVHAPSTSGGVPWPLFCPECYTALYPKDVLARMAVQELHPNRSVLLVRSGQGLVDAMARDVYAAVAGAAASRTVEAEKEPVPLAPAPAAGPTPTGAAPPSTETVFAPASGAVAAPQPQSRVPFALEPGERLLWESPAGGVAKGSWWVTLLVLPAVPFACCLLGSIPNLFGGGEEQEGAWICSATSVLLLCPYVVAFVVTWVLPRWRTSFFMTDRALVARRHLGGFRRILLTHITSAERHVVQIRRRGRVRHVVTDQVRLALHDGNEGRMQLFGPSKSIGRVIELIHNAVLRRWVELDMLPALVGSPPPATTRTDLFFLAHTRSDGHAYGPLFIGPTRVVRLTSALPRDLLDRLYTVLGKGGNGAAALDEFLRAADIGHYIDLQRSETSLVVHGTTLTVGSGEASRAIELGPSDAGRLHRFLGAG